MTIKERADTAFSKWVRQKGYCEWCGTRNAQLQCSHIFSRRFLVTRWFPLNANCLCAGCHFRWHQRPIEAVEWIKDYLGEAVYEELKRIAKTSVVKQDVKQIIDDIKHERGLYVRNK